MLLAWDTYIYHLFSFWDSCDKAHKTFTFRSAVDMLEDPAKWPMNNLRCHAYSSNFYHNTRTPCTNCLIKAARELRMRENASNLLWIYNFFVSVSVSVSGLFQWTVNMTQISICFRLVRTRKCSGSALNSPHAACSMQHVASHQFLCSTGLSAMTFISVAAHGSSRVQWHGKSRQKKRNIFTYA